MRNRVAVWTKRDEVSCGVHHGAWDKGRNECGVVHMEGNLSRCSQPGRFQRPGAYALVS